MNILLCNGGFVNKGAEAMLRTVQHELGRRLGDVRFWHENNGHPMSLDDPALVTTDTHKRFCERTRASRLGNRLLGLPAAFHEPLLPFLDEEAALTITRVPRLGAIVDISGFAYSNAWGGRVTRKAWAFTRYARKAGIPYLYMPQAWGPFSTDHQKGMIRRLHQNAALLYSRDATSSGHLAGAIGIPAEQIPLSPDIAFCFHGQPPESARPLLQRAGLEPASNRPLVGIAPNMRVFERSDRAADGSNLYLAALARIIDHAIRMWDADVVLIPHEVRHRGSEVQDDCSLCRKLAAIGTAPRGRLAAITEDHPAEVVKAVVGCMDLVIGSRYHALIAALSQDRPAIAMGWSHKYEELMGLVGIQPSRVDYKQSPDQYLGLLDEAWRARDANHAHLSQVIPGIKAKVTQVFDRAADTIRHTQQTSTSSRQ